MHSHVDNIADNMIQCSGLTAPRGSTSTWTLRVSFPQYIISLCTVAGSVLFSVSIKRFVQHLQKFKYGMIDEHAVQVFGGAGIATLPMSCIVAFLRRPRATITRSEYIKVNNAAHQPFFCVWRSQCGVLAHIFDCLPRKLLQLVNDPRRSEN